MSQQRHTMRERMPATHHPQEGDPLRPPAVPAAPYFAVRAPLVPGTAIPLPASNPLRVILFWKHFLHRSSIVFVWEIKSFFLRPLSYLLLLAAALLAGWSFSWLVTLLARGTDPALQSGDDPISQFLGPNVFLIGGC